MKAALNKILEEKNASLDHHLLIWATDELIYLKAEGQTTPIGNNHILKFRLFNEIEEYHGFTRNGIDQVRHLSDTETDHEYIEKVVRLKGNIANLIAPNSEKNLMLKSRDYLAYKANGQAYYTDSRMVTIDTLKLITHE